MHDYFKKFSFGISLGISIKDYKNILVRYKQYINSVYFSLPYGDEYHTRIGVKEEYNERNAKSKLIAILKLFKENGIKLELVVNQYNINVNNLKIALEEFDKLIEIDSICCLDEYLDIIINHYKNSNKLIIYSFNNLNLKNDYISKIPDTYDMIVISRDFLRNVDKIKNIKKMGFKTKLLLNNGCSFNCYSCRAGNKMCRKVFENELEENSPQELYAKQSFFPWELNKLYEKMKENNELDIIDELKISNRPCTYEYLNKCLESYIFNEGEEKYLNESFKNYHLWGRQSNLTPYFKDFNLKEINEIKETIWKKNEE